MNESTQSTSASLLVRVQRFEPDSWRRLVDLYGPIVYRWCRRWGVPAADAEDLVQDVFRRVAGGIGKFSESPQGGFRGWLWRIARNVTHDFFQRYIPSAKAGGGTDLHLQLQEIPAEQDSSSGLVDDRSRVLHAALQTVRGDFQPQTWDIFWRSAIGGEETADIAAHYAMTPRAVRQAKHRVLQRLREEFAGLLE